MTGLAQICGIGVGQVFTHGGGAIMATAAGTNDFSVVYGYHWPPGRRCRCMTGAAIVASRYVKTRHTGRVDTIVTGDTGVLYLCVIDSCSGEK